jgi:hypothetical protein
MKSWIQRPEVWVLLLASVAAGFWALGPGPEEAEWQAAPGTAVVEGGRVRLLGGVLERDYGNARLDVTVRIRNEGIHPLPLNPPRTRLLAGVEGGREVPPFFLPTERPPEVAAKSEAEVTLRYWLEAADLKGPLVLEVEGERVAVKEARAFDLEDLENGKPRVLKGEAW